MYCRHCGQPIKDGANFCGRCGEPLDASDRRPARPAGPPGAGAFPLGWPILSILLIYPLWAGILAPLLHWTMRNAPELAALHRLQYASFGRSRIGEIYWASLSRIYPGPGYLMVSLLLFWAVGAGAVLLLTRKGRIRPEAVTWRDGLLAGALPLLPVAVRCLGFLLWMPHLGTQALWGGVYGMGAEWLLYLPHLCYWLLAILLMTARSGQVRLKGTLWAVIAAVLALWSADAHLLSKVLTAPLSMEMEVYSTIYIQISALFLWLRALFYLLLVYWTGRGRIGLAGGLIAMGTTVGTALVLSPVFIFVLHYGVAGGAIAVSLAYVPGLLALCAAAAIHTNGRRSDRN